jgi:hypothetical protein
LGNISRGKGRVTWSRGQRKKNVLTARSARCAARPGVVFAGRGAAKKGVGA